MELSKEQIDLLNRMLSIYEKRIDIRTIIDTFDDYRKRMSDPINKMSDEDYWETIIVLIEQTQLTTKNEKKKSMTHELKILPVYFEAVVNGRKQFEIRKNDRDFQVGDQLILKEWNKDGFTGRACQSEITYITDYMQKNGYVVLSIRVGELANEKL
ncbi:ASCH/PUA domain-containing protein [Enterococcus hirae]